MANSVIYTNPNVGKVKIDFQDTLTLFRVEMSTDHLNPKYMTANKIIEMLTEEYDIPESEIDDAQLINNLRPQIVDLVNPINESSLPQQAAFKLYYTNQAVGVHKSLGTWHVIDAFDPNTYVHNKEYSRTHPSGWIITGKIQNRFSKYWVGEFSASHPVYGEVRGDFNNKVYCTKSDTLGHFLSEFQYYEWSDKRF